MKGETTYGRSFQPQYSHPFQSHKLASKYSLLGKEDHVRLLLYNEEVEAERRGQNRKSSACQTNLYPIYLARPTADSNYYYRRQNACPDCARSEAQAPPPPPRPVEQYYYEPMPPPYVIIEQSPIPGVYTGTPGLQVPVAGYPIVPPQQCYPNQTASPSTTPSYPEYQPSATSFGSVWPQPCPDVFTRSVSPSASVAHNINGPWTPRGMPVVMQYSQMIPGTNMQCG